MQTPYVAATRRKNERRAPVVLARVDVSKMLQ